MANARELRELTADELDLRLRESKAHMFELRERARTGQLKNVKEITLLKKDIARIMTIKSLKECKKDTVQKVTPPQPSQETSRTVPKKRGIFHFRRRQERNK